MSLICGERAAELLAVQHILPRRMPTALGRAESAPGNAVARRVEAGKGAFQSRDARQQVLLRHEYLIHEN